MTLRCPFCYTELDPSKLPIVATNYVAVGTAAATSAGLGGLPDAGVGDSYSLDLPPPATLGADEDHAPRGSFNRNRPVSGAETFGQVGPYPILFDPELRTKRRVGLFSGAPKTSPADLAAQACRQCEMALPTKLGSVDIVTIGVVGNQYAGKTHFLTAVCYEVMRRQRLRGLGFGSAEPVGRTGEDFHYQRYDRVYRKGLAHSRTTSAEGAAAARKPIAIRLERPNSAKSRRPMMLMFHDVPGEWLTDDRMRAQHFGFLNHLDGLILLVDPMAVPSVRSKLQGTVAEEHFHDDLAPQDLLLTNIADQVRDRAATLPVSIVITKSDMLTRAFGPIPELDRPEATTPEQMTADIKALTKIVETRVLGWLDEPALEVAAERFPQAVWHVVAPIGVLPQQLPGSSDYVIAGDIQSQRVMDPVFRVLHAVAATR